MKGYSVFTIKSYDEDKRVVKGIASTPTLDLHGDIVEPSGAKYTLPLPFRFEHGDIAGDITSINITEKGMEMEAKIGSTSDSVSITNQLENFWAAIKSGAVRGLSVGIEAMKDSIKSLPSGGRHFVDWNLTEISAVAVPANIEASILNIKSYDTGVALDPEISSASGTAVVMLSTKNKHLSNGAILLKRNSK